MAWLKETLRQGRPANVAGARSRVIVDEAPWIAAGERLAAGEGSLLSLWGDTDTVNLAALEDESVGVLTLACPTGRFPSIGRLHAPAIRLERTIRDLCGLEPFPATDTRGWLDHGRWGVRQPLGRRDPATATGDAYAFRLAEGPPMHQIPVGPVHAGIIEPGHFRFTANGETVVRLEERLGYVHKGVDRLMAGASIDEAAKLAGRLSGDSTVAYAIAFAQAVEAALGLAPPPRAVWLRALMAELERIANHMGDIGAICNDASFSLMHAHCGILREEVLRASQVCFGHRLMMDCVVPGGVAVDLAKRGRTALRRLTTTIKRRFPELVELYDSTASLQNRTVTTGRLSAELAQQYGAGGFVGRASGRAFDARKLPGYPPYRELRFDMAVRDEGDVDARVWVRIAEVYQSVGLIEQILEGLHGGGLSASLSRQSAAADGREGLALVEGFRGDVLAWVRVAPDGTVARCHLRDPSWFQWPLLEAAIEGNIVADFPLCNKSFNCSYSGHDL
ncbi:MAG: hydrogenase expression protein HypE [Hyphomicrobiaceae bacterium]|nr:hydrogenase expression protein HypE [Hyphomicrobiaceae bacterium]